MPTGGTSSGGSVATGGDTGSGGSSYGTLLWSQDFAHTYDVGTVNESTGYRVLGWSTYAGVCPGNLAPSAIKSDELPNDFAGEIAFAVADGCQGQSVYRFADQGDILYSTDGPTILHDSTGGSAHVGDVAVLTVRKLHWENNPATYTYDYTWSFYSNP